MPPRRAIHAAAATAADTTTATTATTATDVVTAVTTAAVTTAAVTTAAVTTAEVATAAVTITPNVAEVVAETTGEDVEAATNRNQIAVALGIVVPHSRCRNLILHTMGTMTADKGKSIHLAADTAIASAVILDQLLGQLVEHSLATALAAGAHTVEVAHVHGGNLSDVALLSLVSSGAEWTGYTEAGEAALAAAHAAEAKAARDAKAAKKAAEAAGASAAGTTSVAATASGTTDESDDDSGHVGFKTYVDAVWKSAKAANPAYADIKRKAARFSEHVSALLAGCLANLTTLAHVLVTNVANVNTLKAAHIKSVAVMILANSGASLAAAEAALGGVDAKLESYSAFAKDKSAKTAAKKAAEMTPEAIALAAAAVAEKKMAALARKQAKAAQVAAQAAAELASAKSG